METMRSALPCPPAPTATGRAHCTLAEGTPPTLTEGGSRATANSCGVVHRTRLLTIGSVLVRIGTRLVFTAGLRLEPYSGAVVALTRATRVTHHRMETG